jgi:hypothetical protein
LGLFNMIQGIEDEIIEMMKGKKSKWEANLRRNTTKKSGWFMTYHVL